MSIFRITAILNFPMLSSMLISCIIFAGCKSFDSDKSQTKDVIGDRLYCGTGTQLSISDSLAAEIAKVSDNKLCAIRSSQGALCIAKASSSQSCEHKDLQFVEICSFKTSEIICTRQHRDWDRRPHYVAWVEDGKVNSICTSNDEFCNLDLRGKNPSVILKDITYNCIWGPNAASGNEFGFLKAGSTQWPEPSILYVNPTTLTKSTSAPYGTKEEIERLIVQLREKGVCK